MVYVGKSGAVPDETEDGAGRGGRDAKARDDGGADNMKLPPEYRGTAFDRNGELRTYADMGDGGDPLRHAEELFRRGYVFEDANSPDAETADSAARADRGDRVDRGDSAVRADERRGAEADVPVSASGTKRDKAAGNAGSLLSGILGSIGAEEILIGAIILMLLVNGGDDGLLIMLVILLFC